MQACTSEKSTRKSWGSKRCGFEHQQAFFTIFFAKLEKGTSYTVHPNLV
jgi:hypothetical protein